MTTTITNDLDLLRTRMAGAMAGQLPGHMERLGWSAGQLAAFQRDRLRALLARAIERSPFHAERLRGVDPSRFELADLPRLPVMTKAQMMADFDRATTDPRLTRELVEQHLARSTTEPSLLLGEYVCLLSGGSSGLRGLVVQRVSEYADFVATIMRRFMASAMASGGLPPEGLVIGIVGAGSPVHSSGLGAATAFGPPVRMISAPATLPTAEIVRRLNAAQPPALMGYAAKLAELAREQRDGRLRLSLRSVISNSEALSPAERTAIGDAFGVPVIDLFVSTEGLVGHSEPGQPVFTFASDTCIAECTDEAGQPVPSGVASSKVLLTNLLGTLGPVALMTLALVLACLVSRRWTGAVLAAVAVPAATGLTEYVLKPSVGQAIGQAFPSGHATSMFALAASCAVLLVDPRRQVPGAVRVLLVGAAVLLAAAVAAAMVAIGAHHFTDAVGGAAVGTAVVLACALTLDLAASRRPRGPAAPPLPGG